MANIKSAAKRARQSLKRNTRNHSRKNRVRTYEKQLRKAIAQKKSDEAKNLLVTFSSEMDKAAKKGAFHPNKAARKISRLSSQVQQLS